ncbi:MAG: hypothetical protein ACI8YQ_004178 [Polaribacter sp.]|jgi:hypothetical protein
MGWHKKNPESTVGLGPIASWIHERNLTYINLNGRFVGLVCWYGKLMSYFILV